MFTQYKNNVHIGKVTFSRHIVYTLFTCFLLRAPFRVAMEAFI